MKPGFWKFTCVLLAGLALHAPASMSAGPGAPLNLFSIGDSIGVGEAADGDIGKAIPGSSWSTGYDTTDVVDSLNERFETSCPADYVENTSVSDGVYNHAVSGAEMADFAAQAASVVTAAANSVEGTADMVTVLLGANDMCAASIAAMTSPPLFESRFRAGLDVLAASAQTSDAYIHVSGIPALYWLWNARRSSGLCPLIWNLGDVCQALLASPGNDCGSGNSHLNPDVIQVDDGSNCQRRKDFHALIRDVYNPILENVVAEYKGNGILKNAYYVDVFDVEFSTAHVNGGDCFHPSFEGQALLAEAEWSRSPWPLARIRAVLPAIFPLLLGD